MATSRIILKTFFAAFVKLGSAVLSYLMLLIIARSLGDVEFGKFSVAFSLALFLSKVATAGQPQKVMFEIGQNVVDEERSRYFEILKNSFGVLIVVSAAVSIVLTIISIMLGEGTYVFVAFLVLFLALSELQTFVLRSNGGIINALVPREIIWRLFLCIYFGFMIYRRATIDSDDSLLIVAILLGVCVIAQNYISLHFKFWLKLNRCCWEDCWSWFKNSRSYAVIAIVANSVPTLSTVLVGFFVSTNVAGPYFAALKTSQTMTLVFLAINLVVAPLLGRLYALDNTTELQKICTLSALVSTAASAIVLVLIVLFGRALLEMFGEGFSTGYIPLVIISLGYFMTSFFGSNAQLLQMSGNQGLYMKLTLIINIVGLSLMATVVKGFGVIGISLVVSISMVVWNVFAWYYARIKCGIDTSALSVLRSVNPKSL